ncbi:4-oxalomesaconate hydratase [marine gamma proteobacterium HTCC2207]|jgi:4-oxalmesaconate hydratase|uniref:4-oxalomesaconate hydratase n=1 Tax=gamma proteobacterium HTCC2207 TaxID=314287 RepID=Q1YUG8_9GAMM|nr:4-oxalomesaconate hydratase [marine gamma proteobacterium HTCC2207] [gamma proteobacterium HTCC2207]
MNLIIDCHGHQTLVPQAHLDFRAAQLARLEDPSKPRPSLPVYPDSELYEIIANNQYKLQQERGADITIFSPRASAMEPHIGDTETSIDWAQACNNMIKRTVDLFPDNFVGVCQLPQQVKNDKPAGLEDAIEELERCVLELGFIGCNLNPDPSGGHFSAPPLTDRYWYPLYEKMVELRVPAMIHVSGSCNACLHATGSYYMAADTNAFMNLITGDLFADFPELNFVIPHGGGAVPYHWGRYRGLADMLGKPTLDKHLMQNVYFDTCVYHQPGIDLLCEVIDPKNILFASEMIGAVRCIDPETGFYFDDTKRYLENLDLTADARHDIFEGNARRIYPRLDELLKGRGL